ncbi:ligand-gated channel [Morganella morganii]|uniref:TonB-dependent receptor n=1 Tax=Morganella morganii TaxID=582 RepID=UPI001C7DE342|nr:TonB-dependent siderophore receptor [Morganella morganii]GIZ26740.1 ligand-gated channel [Morganella morganii]GIZ31708.1 ligand-gated channel [Morganella morganii]GIZ33323.1 ligand-gated channel [Morganella morganii]
MTTKYISRALLPALISVALFPAQQALADTIIVTDKPSHITPQTQAGAGFVATDIDMGPLGTRQWLDIPYSSNTVSEAMIRNQQSKSVSEMLKYLPSSQMQARGGMNVGRPQSRGMQGSVVENSRLNGLNIVSTTAFPVEMLERLDAVNSLTGAIYGPASPSGQFNFISKRPTQDPLHRVTVGYQNRNAYSAHLDLGGQADEEKTFGYRLNLLDEEGEGYVRNSKIRRQLAAVALDWQIRPGTQIQLDASHYHFVTKGFPGSFGYGPDIDLPNAPDSSNPDLALNTAGNDLTTDSVSTRFTHYMNDNWSLSGGIGYQQADRAMRSVSSQILDSKGTISRSITDSPAAGRFRVLSNNLTLNGQFDTGSVNHDVALATTGYTWSIYSAKERGKTFQLGNTNMYDPSSMTEPSDGRIRTGGERYKASENQQQSIIIGDTVTFNPQWSAMVYVSQSWITTRNFDKQGHKTDRDQQTGTSPNMALMYKITPDVMTYISYADSLQPGDTAPDDDKVKNRGETLSPYRSTQYEWGIKANTGNMNLSAAVFRLKRPFAYTDSDQIFKKQGEQVNDGLELTATGNVWQGLNIYSGVTFLKAELTDTGNNKTEDKRVVGVPKVQANLLMEYSLPSVPQWVYSANIHYTGKRAANDTNTSWADSYTTLDLGARYTTQIENVPVTLRISADNVTNEHYWASIFPGNSNGKNGGANAFTGAGREFRATVSFDF